MQLIKKYILIITFMMFSIIALSFEASAGNNNPITKYTAVINMEYLASESSAAKDIKDQIKKIQDKYQQKISEKEEMMMKKEKELGEQASILSKEALLEKQDEFHKELIEIKKEIRVKKIELNQILKQALSELQQKILLIVKDISKENNISLVLPVSQIIYGDDLVNITEKVLKKLNKELPKININ